MRYGLALPTGMECGDPRFLVELAGRAEAAGWDGVFLEDYVVFQGDPAAPTCDPWIALAGMAVRTERVLLGTAVTPLARRRPWIVARQAAAIDQLSGGRMILGAGLGDVGDHVVRDASFTHFGEEADARQRARMLDEALDIVAGLWSGEPFSYRGEHFTVDEVSFVPPPVPAAAHADLDRGRLSESGPDPAGCALGWIAALRGSGTRPLAGRRQSDTRGGRRSAVRHRRRRPCAGGGLGGRTRAAAGNRISGRDLVGRYVPADSRDAMRAGVDRGPLRID